MNSLELKLAGIAGAVIVLVVALGYAHYEKGRADAAHSQLLAQAAQYKAAAATATMDAAKQAATLKASAAQLAAQLAAANSQQQVKLQTVTKVIREASGSCLDQPVPATVLRALQGKGVP